MSPAAGELTTGYAVAADNISCDRNVVIYAYDSEEETFTAIAPAKFVASGYKYLEAYDLDSDAFGLVDLIIVSDEIAGVQLLNGKTATAIYAGAHLTVE